MPGETIDSTAHPISRRASHVQEFLGGPFCSSYYSLTIIHTANDSVVERNRRRVFAVVAVVKEDTSHLVCHQSPLHMSGFNITTGAPGFPESNITSAIFGSSSITQDRAGYNNKTAHGSSPNRPGRNPFKAKQSEDYGPQVNFTIWLLTALSAAFLALRVYCKFLRHRGLWWDDHMLIAAWVRKPDLSRTARGTWLTNSKLSLVTSSAFVSVSITLGFGRPLSEFNFENLELYLLFVNLAGTFSIFSALWSKTSFAITVLRISSGRVKVLVWFIIITVNLSLGVAVAFTWCQCTPFVKVWQPRVPGECWDKDIQIRYNIFTAGTFVAQRHIISLGTEILTIRPLQFTLEPWISFWHLFRGRLFGRLP